MHVVAVNGSPRTSGNTAVLCNAFLDGAKETGAEATLLQLGTMEIKPCDACKACKDRKPCVIEDDMRRFYEIAAETDLLLLASPVYLDHITANLMAFIQRLYCYLGMGLESYWPNRNCRAVVGITYGAGRADMYDYINDWMAGRMKGYWSIPTEAKFVIPSCVHTRPISPSHPEAVRAKEVGHRIAGRPHGQVT